MERGFESVPYMSDLLSSIEYGSQRNSRQRVLRKLCFMCCMKGLRSSWWLFWLNSGLPIKSISLFTFFSCFILLCTSAREFVKEEKSVHRLVQERGKIGYRLGSQIWT